MTETQLTPVQQKLFAAVKSYGFFLHPFDVLSEIIAPGTPDGPQNFWWYWSVSPSVRELWAELPLDAKLVAALAACEGLDTSEDWNI